MADLGLNPTEEAVNADGEVPEEEQKPKLVNLDDAYIAAVTCYYNKFDNQ